MPERRSQIRWRHDLATIGNTIVGSIAEVHGQWYASGMLVEWEDVKLGAYPTRESAKEAVERWVEAQCE